MESVIYIYLYIYMDIDQMNGMAFDSRVDTPLINTKFGSDDESSLEEAKIVAERHVPKLTIFHFVVRAHVQVVVRPDGPRILKPKHGAGWVETQVNKWICSQLPLLH